MTAALESIRAACADLRAAAPESLLSDPEGLLSYPEPQLIQIRVAADSIVRHTCAAYFSGCLPVPTASALTNGVQLLLCVLRALRTLAARAKPGEEISLPPGIKGLLESAFCRALVRSQALHAHSMLVAQMVEWLKAMPVVGDGQSSGFNVETAFLPGQVLRFSAQMVCILLGTAQRSHRAAAALLAETQAAVRDSAIFAHMCDMYVRFAGWCRAVSPPTSAYDLRHGVVPGAIVQAALGSVLLCLPKMCKLLADSLADSLEDEAKGIANVPRCSPPSVQYCIAASLWGVMAMADGSPTHGLVSPTWLAAVERTSRSETWSEYWHAGASGRSPMWGLLDGLAHVWSRQHFEAVRQQIAESSGVASGDAVTLPPQPLLFSAAQSFDLVVRAVMSLCAAGSSTQERGAGRQQQAGSSSTSSSIGTHEHALVLCTALCSAHAALEVLPAGQRREARLPAFWRALCAAVRLAVPASLDPGCLALLSLARARLGLPDLEGAHVKLGTSGVNCLVGAAMRAGGSAADDPRAIAADKVVQGSKCGVLVAMLWSTLRRIGAPPLELAEALVAVRKMMASEACCGTAGAIYGGAWVKVLGTILNGQLWAAVACAALCSPAAADMQSMPEGGEGRHEQQQQQRQGEGEGPLQAGVQARAKRQDQQQQEELQLRTFLVLQLLPTLMDYVALQLHSSTDPEELVEKAESALGFVVLPCQIIAHHVLTLQAHAQAAGADATCAAASPALASPGCGAMEIPVRATSTPCSGAAAAAAEAQAWVHFMRHTLRMADVAAAVVRYIMWGLVHEVFDLPFGSQDQQQTRSGIEAVYLVLEPLGSAAATLLALMEAVDPGSLRKLLAEEHEARARAQGVPPAWFPLDAAILVIYGQVEGCEWDAVSLALLAEAKELEGVSREAVPQRPAAHLAAFGKAWIEEELANGLEELQGGAIHERLRDSVFERHRWLLPPAEGAALLPAGVCANPLCTVLAGDSEQGAAAALKACGRCGGPRYCCKRCQVTHWLGGHKRECVRAAASAAAMGAAATAPAVG